MVPATFTQSVILKHSPERAVANFELLVFPILMHIISHRRHLRIFLRAISKSEGSVPSQTHPLGHSNTTLRSFIYRSRLSSVNFLTRDLFRKYISASLVSLYIHFRLASNIISSAKILHHHHTSTLYWFCRLRHQ